MVFFSYGFRTCNFWITRSGEFTLWKGQSFNFKMILQARDQPIRSMVWSHNDNYMVSVQYANKTDLKLLF
ncbi:hypothetical protein ARALYDRAFT_900500 [Arabidopsis lyrata subsp. lyrata]|uniref:Uncharacterized protein n=1 Tax=Arabidopsis lyrata subsp. lyrata TaxID=81972 RepID=D7LKJ8_ARALL|nr:hypothetical protein ARALYDRAFT_900500 [Arabidopsis lyrata subsp. lyrata]